MDGENGNWIKPRTCCRFGCPRETYKASKYCRYHHEQRIRSIQRTITEAAGNESG